MQQADHLWGLDALRGIASIAVLILHIYVYFALKIPGLPSIVSHAHLAVDAFFVMSGFVIAHSFDLRLQRGMSVSRFLWLRALRLYPLIAVGAVVGGACLLAFAFTRKDVPLSAVCTATFSAFVLLPTGILRHVKPYAFPANSVFWSLSVEVVFYVVYAVSFSLLSKIRVLVSCVLVALVTVVAVCLHEKSLDIGYFLTNFGSGYERAAYSFLIGLLLRRSGLFRPASFRYGALAVPILAGCLLNPISPSVVYDIIVVVCVFPTVVLVTANATPIAAAVRPARIGGQLSYSLYAIHFPIVVALANASKSLSSGVRLECAAACLMLLLRRLSPATSTSISHFASDWRCSRMP